MPETFANNALFGIGPLGIVAGAGCTTNGTYTAATAFEAGLQSAMGGLGGLTASGNRQIATACASGDLGCVLRPACTTPQNCLKDTFVELSDDVGFTTLFGSGYRYPATGAACALTQGGVTLPDVGDDAFGVARSAPFSIGAHEQDGACAAQ